MYFAKHYTHILIVVMLDHRIPYEMTDKKKNPMQKIKNIPSSVFTYGKSRYKLSVPHPPISVHNTSFYTC